MSRSIAFVGPTYAPIRTSGVVEQAGFELRPPARRNDIAVLLDEPPGLIALVDGVFNQSLAVGHAELRRAIHAGWSVWGLGSMGAIRAYELRTLGMHGFGRVFGHFLAGDDFQDDEVALAHFPAEPYHALSEPLVHYRHTVAAMERDGELRRAEANAVIGALKARWFVERTHSAFVEAVERVAGKLAGQAARHRAARIDEYRVKTADLAAFCREQPWRAGDYVASAEPAPYDGAYERHGAMIHV